MNRLPTFALALAMVLPALPAAARDFVQDQAGLFSAQTVASLNAKIGSFNAQTGKDVVVVTVLSLNGATLESAAQSAFQQQNVNGVLIFIAKDDRRDFIVSDRAGAQWFPPSTIAGIRQSMESQFRTENFDAGITGAVDAVLGVYRSHLGSLRSNNAGAGVPASSSSSNGFQFGGFHLSMFWWIIIAIVGFLILRSILRAFSGPRYIGGPTGGGIPPGGMGYGPGYGGGGFGGGGGFWSGMLGGLGGAWLGNEIFGQHGGGVMPADAAQQTQPMDNSGWQSDAGQADMSGGSAGDWGGGGFGDTGGGGFGGGDFGGGGDSGGGW